MLGLEIDEALLDAQCLFIAPCGFCRIMLCAEETVVGQRRAQITQRILVLCVLYEDLSLKLYRLFKRTLRGLCVSLLVV